MTDHLDNVPEPEDPWALAYDRWAPERQPLREALSTLGNGYFATRGAAEETSAGGPHYPGTYLASGYNRLESEVAGRTIENEDLVNWPNWLCLSFRCEGGEWFHIDKVEVLGFRQSLDLRRGVLRRRLRVRQQDGRETTLDSRRIVHMAQPHLAAIQWTLTPHNWSGRVEIRSALDGAVVNQGVERYRALSSKHLQTLETGQTGEDGIFLCVRTNQSHIQMTQAARTRASCDGAEATPERRVLLEEESVEQRLVFAHCEAEKPLRIEKTVALYTSRDPAISHPRLAACQAIADAGTFDALLESHERAWKRLWNRADIELDDGHDTSQLILRLHIFHLLQTTSLHSVDWDMGVPARGWHGEAYRGHIFWDELFIYPLLNLRMPELSRSLLMYRRRRLGEARRLARDSGFRGAMFPWQSGSSGREESQVLHLNPQSGRWIPDNSHRQRHINAAIAYNVWQYFQATDDLEFLSFYGAEMLLEIARFWASAATYNPQRERYEIHGVVGPDEFHTRYPDTDSQGLNNNAYTNVMAVWTLDCARHALDLLPPERRSELAEELEIGDDELQAWDEIGRRMFVPFLGERIIGQFEGYEDLEEFDWDGYRQKYGDIQRLDRILEAEGDTPNRYKASKQADALMLFFLFSSDELCGLFERLGYPFEPDDIPKTIEYYVRRTSHGSTLSRVVHSWVLARRDRRRAWRLFQQALQSDVSDIQGGTTPEGIHLGAMAGTVDLIQRCYTGLEIHDDVLWFNPSLPEELKETRLRLRYRGHWLRVRVTHEELSVTREPGGRGPAKIGFRGQVHSLSEGERKVFGLAK